MRTQEQTLKRMMELKAEGEAIDRKAKVAKWLKDNPEVGYLNSGTYYVMNAPGCMRVVPELADPRMWR